MSYDRRTIEVHQLLEPLSFNQIDQPNWLSEEVPVAGRFDTTFKYSKGILGKIEKLCFSFLLKRKIMTQHIKRTKMLEYKSITCELDSIIEELFKQQRMIRALFNQEIDCIVVGRQMFDMLNQAIFLQFPHGYSVHYGNQQVSLGGMPLVLVPWFKGVLALPKKSN